MLRVRIGLDDQSQGTYISTNNVTQLDIDYVNTSYILTAQPEQVLLSRQILNEYK